MYMMICMLIALLLLSHGGQALLPLHKRIPATSRRRNIPLNIN